MSGPAGSGHTSPAEEAQKAAQDYLLQEHSSIETDTQRLRQEGATRLNILVVVIAAVATATATVVTSHDVTLATKAAIGYGVLGSVLIYTLLCYKYFIDREVVTDSNFRAASRIRRYYVDLYPTLESYLSWGTTDGATQHLKHNRSFLLPAVRHLVAIQVAGGLATALVVAGLADWACVLLAVLSYALSTLVLWLWSARRFRRAASSADAHARFPRPDNTAKGITAK